MVSTAHPTSPKQVTLLSKVIRMKLWSKLQYYCWFCPKLRRFKGNTKPMYVFVPWCHLNPRLWVHVGWLYGVTCLVGLEIRILPNPYWWCTISKRHMKPPKTSFKSPRGYQRHLKYMFIMAVCCVTASAVNPWSFFHFQRWIMTSLMDASIPWCRSVTITELQTSVSRSALPRKAILDNLNLEEGDCLE